MLFTAATIPRFSPALAESAPSQAAFAPTARAAPQAAAPGPQAAPAMADKATTVLLVAPGNGINKTITSTVKRKFIRRGFQWGKLATTFLEAAAR